MKRWQLMQRQGLPLQAKIIMSKIRIQSFYENLNVDGDIYVALSGKDSRVLLDLVRSLYPNTLAVFVDTGVEYPEVVNIIKNIANVRILKPKKSFYQIVNEGNVPFISKKISMGINRFTKTKSEVQRQLRLWGGINPTSGKKQHPTISQKYHYLLNDPVMQNVSEKCCKYLKKDPFVRFEKETGLKPLIGTMTNESSDRREQYLKNGCNAFEKTIKSSPISFWTEQDILKYIEINKIEIASVYGDIVKKNNSLHLTGVERTGCMGCMYGIIQESKKGLNRFQRMKLTHPKHYDFYINKLNFKYYLDLINIKY